MATKQKSAGIPDVQDLFRECTDELGMKGFRLVTTRKEFAKITGVTPRELGKKYSHRAAVAPAHKLIWLSELFVKDRLNWEYPDVEEVKEAIYHELLHTKHPRWSEERVDKEARRLVAEPKPELRILPSRVTQHPTSLRIERISPQQKPQKPSKNVYSDKKGERIARKHHRGWRRVKY